MDADLYEILGVAPSATQHEIRAAYRAAAKRLHPDVAGSNEAMLALNLAYEVLSDPSRRERLDVEFGGRFYSFEEVAAAFSMSWGEPEFVPFSRAKLAALNREHVLMESEGWAVEWRHDHLVGTRSERTPGSWFKRRERRVTVSVDRDGRAHRHEQPTRTEG